MGILKRISKAIKEIERGDYEDALIHICIAIDATAKNEFLDEGKSLDRYKLFLQNNEPSPAQPNWSAAPLPEFN